MKINFLFLATVVCVSMLFSCHHDPDPVLLAQDTVCFKTDILPIIQNNCGKSGCHNGYSRDENYNSVADILKDVKKNDPYGSKLYQNITNEFAIMPPSPNAPLTKDQRTKIFVWIQKGADTSSTCK